MKRPSLESLLTGFKNRDRALLSQAISLTESTLAADQDLVEELLQALSPISNRSLRIGLSGIPGAGKSTLMESLGKKYLEDASKSIAVLAVDPSSPRSGGSILGDKTRMTTLSNHPRAFIRPSPSRGHLGGVTTGTRESVRLCETFGFDAVVVETVGIGQAESEISEIVDTFAFIAVPGTGDDLQGIKRGVLEVCDFVIVNKADGPGLTKAKQSKADYEFAFQLIRPKASGWVPKVLLGSALENTGIIEIWNAFWEHRAFLETSGTFLPLRQIQAESAFEREFLKGLERKVFESKDVQPLYSQLKKQLSDPSTSPGVLAKELLNQIRFVLEKKK